MKKALLFLTVTILMSSCGYLSQRQRHKEALKAEKEAMEWQYELEKLKMEAEMERTSSGKY